MTNRMTTHHLLRTTAAYSLRAYFAPLRVEPYRAVAGAIREGRGIVGALDAWADVVDAIGHGRRA